MDASNSVTTNLFLSFTATWKALCAGDLSASDFDGALFYFGCNRGRVEGTDDLLAKYCEEYGELKARTAFAALHDALQVAEYQDVPLRVAWPWQTREQVPNIEQLNELLDLHGLPPIDISECPQQRLRAENVGSYLTQYYPPNLAAVVEQQELPYRIIC